MRSSIWNVTSMYRTGLLVTVARELSEYTFHLVGVQEVRWDRGGIETSGKFHFSMERGLRIMN
jgi:hypothetical protein